MLRTIVMMRQITLKWIWCVGGVGCICVCTCVCVRVRVHVCTCVCMHACDGWEEMAEERGVWWKRRCK